MRRVIVAATASALLLTACAEPSAPPAETQQTSIAPPKEASIMPSGEYDVLATGLHVPWSVIPREDGSAYVSLRVRAQIVLLGTDGATTVLARVAAAAPESEGGLLGLARLEDGDDAWLYAYVTTAEDNRILRFDLDESGDAPTLGAPSPVLTGIPKAGIHNGGRLAFGPDGMLYATTGDATGGDVAQNRDSLAGKILRMTPTGEVPEDNPFDGSLVYSYGHRNPQGLAWTSDGQLWASEFGQDTWDELNRIEPGGNYGWPVVEGVADDDRFVDPVRQWTTDEASPSGLTAIEDTLFMAALGGQRLWVIGGADTASGSPEVSAEEWFVGEFGRIRDVVPGPDGGLWMLTNNTDGRGDPAADDDRLVEVQLIAANRG